MKIRKKNSIHFLLFAKQTEKEKVFLFFLQDRLWPTIFHDSENFVIIIDGYENVECWKGETKREKEERGGEIAANKGWIIRIFMYDDKHKEFSEK